MIGAALSSGFGSVIGSVSSKLSQLQKKSQSITLKESVGREFIDLKEQTLRVRREFEAAGGKSKELGISLAKLEQQTVAAQTTAQKYGFDIDKVAQQTKYLGIVSQQTEGKIGRMQARMARAQARGALKGELLGVASMGYALRHAIQPAIRFEESFADVKKVVSGSDAMITNLRRNALGLTRELPMSGEEINKIMTAAAQSGISGRTAIVDFTRTTAKMGVAFDISSEEAGAAMAEIKNSCTLTQPQMVNLGDAINYLSNNTASSAGDIVEYMRRVGAVGKIVGMTEVQMAALGATFKASGTAPEIGARASAHLLMTLANVTKQSKSVKSAFQDMGYNDLAALERSMKIDPQKTILGFLERVSKQKNVIGALSGTMGTGFADEIAKLVKGMKLYAQAIDLVAKKENYAGSMEAEFQARAKTTANAIQLMKNRLTVTSVDLGSAFLPMLVDTVNIIGSVADKFSKWAEKNPQLVKTIGALIIGFVGMKAAMLGTKWAGSYVLDGLSMMNGGFQMLRPSVIQAQLAVLRMKGTGSIIGGIFSTLKGNIFGFGKTVLSELKIAALGVKALGTAILTTPVGWFLLAAVAIGTAAYLIWKHWDFLKAKMTGWWPSISKAWTSIGEAVKAPFKTAFKWIGDKIDWLSSKWTDLKNLLGGTVTTPTTKAGKSVPVPEVGHALGGIFDKPHVAAISEGGKREAIIPLEGNRARARSIYAAAGSALGIKQQYISGGSACVIKAEFNINVTSSTEGEKIAAYIKQALADLERKAKSQERGRFEDAPVFG